MSTRYPTRTATSALLAAFVPELGLLTALWQSSAARVRRSGSDRGDAVQWVILAALGAALAITAGTIVFAKIKSKASSITTDTPSR